MKFTVAITLFLLASEVTAIELSNWLKANNPNSYFPDNASYLEFPEVCNSLTCFHIVVVSYSTTTNKGMNRVAVFSQEKEYIGNYAGFSELPLNVKKNTLFFPKNSHGYTITFSETYPPPITYIDGEHFEFEPMP